ncbi:hypothetical protein [Aquisalinus flavus]|nr:hypothetical protein [Aquisalinus flavus]UNE47146.1 hypothetical protein FF099_03275 [Aquisalinus flavus]
MITRSVLITCSASLLLFGCSQEVSSFKKYELDNVSAEYDPATARAGITAISISLSGRLDPSSSATLVDVGRCGNGPAIHTETDVDGEFMPIQIMSGSVLLPIDVSDAADDYATVFALLSEQTSGVRMIVSGISGPIVEAPFVPETDLIMDSGTRSGPAYFDDGSSHLQQGNIPWCLSGRIEYDTTTIMNEFIRNESVSVRFVDRNEDILLAIDFSTAELPSVLAAVFHDIRDSQ